MEKETHTKALSPLVSAQELADNLDLSVKTVQAWRYKGSGPASFRAGGQIRYRLEDVQAWLEERLGEPV